MKKLFFQNIFIAKEVVKHPLLEKVLSSVPHEKEVSVTGERHPGNGLLLTRNRGAFLKPCPGQKGNVCCGYWVVEWGMGCPMKCRYCILQNYISAGDITWYLNWEDCLIELAELRKKIKGKIRLGTGEFGDSLALEEIFPLNSLLIDYSRKLPGIIIEIKTKCGNLKSLETLKATENVVAAFSLNPQSFIDKFENGTSNLDERLFGAKQLAEAGFKIAFHFDPLLAASNWKEEYASVTAMIRKDFAKYQIPWISLGTFRFPKGFPEKILDIDSAAELFSEEFFPCTDGKMRYFRPLREELYAFILREL